MKSIVFNPTKFHKSQMPAHVILAPLALFMSLPILYIINDAFKPFNELFAYPPRFFAHNPTLENFELLYMLSTETGIPLARYLGNSLMAAIIVVFLSVFLSSVTAFSISKLDFKGKRTYFEINTYALMFVPVAVAIPRFFMLVQLGVYNSFSAHIIPLLAMPVGLFLVKQFMDQIPDELIEAARIDGATNFQVYFKVMLPLTKSALVTVAFLAFQTSWMNTEASNIFMDIEALRTLPFYLSTLSQSSGNVVAARGVSAVGWLILFLPNLLIFLFLQSKVMESMAQSGIKS
jgi:ABC-type glycerol-3-phosphate transport system permease component